MDFKIGRNVGFFDKRHDLFTLLFLILSSAAQIIQVGVFIVPNDYICFKPKKTDNETLCITDSNKPFLLMASEMFEVIILAAMIYNFYTTTKILKKAATYWLICQVLANLFIAGIAICLSLEMETVKTVFICWSVYLLAANCYFGFLTIKDIMDSVDIERREIKSRQILRSFQQRPRPRIIPKRPFRR